MTVGRIRWLESLRYFAKGAACELGEETILEPTDDEANVFKEFFTAGLQMPPHPALTNILIKCRVQPHQWTSNAFTQLSK
jgi:hypothetical protein